jgi:hypothetical protein
VSSALRCGSSYLVASRLPIARGDLGLNPLVDFGAEPGDETSDATTGAENYSPRERAGIFHSLQVITRVRDAEIYKIGVAVKSPAYGRRTARSRSAALSACPRSRTLPDLLGDAGDRIGLIQCDRRTISLWSAGLFVLVSY